MWDTALDELKRRRSEAEAGGGTERIEAQKRKGKLTARERLSILLDEGTFTEIGDMIMPRITDFDADKKSAPGDGVITGAGKINGRLVFVYSEDFTVIGGTLGEYHSKKICAVMDMAEKMRAPLIQLEDSGGARIEEGVSSLSGYSGIFLRNTRLSGVVPQIAVILGPCAGGACYSPAICDFIFMAKETSLMFITGPQVVKSVTGETVTAQELGGAEMHREKSGVCHFVYDDDRECLLGVRRLLSYLPQNNSSAPERVFGRSCDDSASLINKVPDNPRKAYDVREVVSAIADKDSFLEVQADFAKNAVCGFFRLDGCTVGVVANQPAYMGGALDCGASDKLARFVRFSDSFNIPILTLVDVPAFLPGLREETMGIIRHGAKLLYAFSEATVPKVTLILRKAYGGAYIAMNSKEMGADTVLAWPIAQLAVMGAQGAADIIFKHRIASAADPAAEREKCVKEYEDKFMNPWIAAQRGFVDKVIAPAETRAEIAAAFDVLRLKKSDNPAKKHGNIPL